MGKELRKTGIDLIGNVSWGTHFCQFYQTPEDLIDILVPYFKAGLENNEFCMWITAEPLNAKKAKASLKKVVRNLDDYIEKGQIEILDFSQWYTKSGKFDAEEVLDSWVEKEKQALERGFDGLRLTGNTFWLEDKDWGGFTEYEEMINDVIGNYKMIAVCSYSLDKCGATEIIDVVANHQFALIKRENRWKIIESSERKQAEEALRESEEKYRTILESIEDGYYEVDLAGNFTFFNDSMCKISGYSRDELMGMNYRQYTNEQDSEKLYNTLNKVYTTGKPSGIMDHMMVRKDGTERYIELSGSLIKDSEGHRIGFRGIIRDVTERKKLESQLRQAQKMEAIATLAGGIAHEFNNALTGIIGNVELIDMFLPEDKDFSRYIDPMKSSAHRMANLTNQLLAYARGGKYKPTTISLSDFVKDTLPVLESTIEPSIRIETDLPRDISEVKVDPTQMQMVLSAVLYNASEAIEGEGRIRINTGDEEIDEDFAKDYPDIEPGSYVCLTIEDDGKGMDEETRSKIFDPFFTTKFQGRGLGMAAVYGIIRNHDGWILVDSKIDKGTVVRIYFPVLKVKEEQVPEKRVKGSKTEIPMGTGTILVIEDEQIVMDLTYALLEGLGYRVLEAKTGKEAVDIAKGFDGDIDLAILDIKLPDIMGDKVYPLIMEARPNLKVVVCSGYSIDGPAQEIIDAGAQGFIQKPFSLKILAEKLMEVLEG